MAPPREEKSQLKRPRGSLPDSDTEAKKPRRSERLSVDKTPVSHKQHLPSPVTRSGDSDDVYKEPTATPPEGRPSQVNHREKDDNSQSQAHTNLSSPPQDTQAFSQYPADNKDVLCDEVEDEVKEGVWGYLFPLDTKYGKCLVMKKRAACPMPDKLEAKETEPVDRKGKSPLKKEEEAYEKTKIKGVASGGYLIGRHPECVDLIDSMLVVDPERRFTVDQCLNHPWMTQKQPGVNDSTDGLVGGIQGLEVHRRGVVRERTLLSSMNSVAVAERSPGPKQKPVKIYSKNTTKTTMTPKEADPASQRNVDEFVEMGGKGDQPLFGDDGDSIYSKADISTEAQNGSKEE
ncbi:hypothetical protein CCHR01_09132 [Colletotrichum chrysophilum]|uniref:Uncharacterized protein n=1 Tax=Colletotrichum chrysophilum TaxID=1836956 RepID=A0AAD9AK94_9PEZI|nr:hypothetical protein CCHR01_09132 [Colletotrichum chrysophilum]